MRFATILAAFAVSSAFALPSSTQHGKALVARQTAGQTAVKQYNAAQAEFTAAQKVYLDLARKESPQRGFSFRDTPSPELIAAGARYSTARTKLEGAETTLLITADTPKDYKLRILAERLVDAERELRSDRKSLVDTQEQNARSVAFWTEAVNTALTPEKRASRQWLLDRTKERLPEQLKEDQAEIDESLKKVQGVQAEIARVNALPA